MLAGQVPQGPFALSGPNEKLDPAVWPVRGDLAHIALAGRLFVPHYAVPQPRKAKVDNTCLRDGPDLAADSLLELAQGQCFDVLDIQGEWAWGIMNGMEGPVGYIRADQLEQPEQ